MIESKRESANTDKIYKDDKFVGVVQKVYSGYSATPNTHNPNKINPFNSFDTKLEAISFLTHGRR